MKIQVCRGIGNYKTGKIWIGNKLATNFELDFRLIVKSSSVRLQIAWLRKKRKNLGENGFDLKKAQINDQMIDAKQMLLI